MSHNSGVEGLHARARTFMNVFLVVLLVLCFTSTGKCDPVPPQVQAYSAVLIDSITGKVLYEKRCHARRPPASTTKMMTAILAIEKTKPTDTVCASPNACQTPFGSLNLKPGEQMRMYDLLYGMLLRSANDAAESVAEHVAGSPEAFAKMMNDKAAEIGLHDTHFVNPHGLYTPGHYSTAYDLAMIARYAIQYPLFNEIVRTKSARIDRSLNTLDVSLRNTAHFLWKFQGADGIKTGYTREAGHCFVGSATRNGWRLISVVLHSDKAGQDTSAIMQYGFDNFKPVIFARKGIPYCTLPVTGGIQPRIRAMPSNNLAFVVKKNTPVSVKTDVKTDKISAPIFKGTKVGSITAYINGKSMGAIDLLADQDVLPTLSAKLIHMIKNILLGCGVIILGLYIYGTAVTKVARRRRRRVPARRREVYRSR